MTTLFGHCLDGLHYACRSVTTDGHPCGCQCHTAADESNDGKDDWEADLADSGDIRWSE